MAVLNNWPAFFTFAIVGVAKGYLMDALPNMGGGLGGTIYNGAVQGMDRTISFVTWDLIKQQRVGA